MMRWAQAAAARHQSGMITYLAHFLRFQRSRVQPALNAAVGEAAIVRGRKPLLRQQGEQLCSGSGTCQLGLCDRRDARQQGQGFTYCFQRRGR